MCMNVLFLRATFYPVISVSLVNGMEHQFTIEVSGIWPGLLSIDEPTSAIIDTEEHRIFLDGFISSSVEARSSEEMMIIEGSIEEQRYV